ncbi:alginate export family protein [Zunongwangia sp. F260]|uniref:Alginate export family protein n=1 Tax=Autumnicola lenta TaxID=3075593 RepID=A0ABU3CMS1_9FLAO|nr:alginate export family protein [Zunongwangia sp. F260]MDT0647532.1 alginate export family protein [Zunongwangia sp. F260]
MKNHYYTFLIFFIFTASAFSQTFTLDADIRPRFEYRHGFGNLFPDNTDPAAFVTQRSRLNFGYAADRLQVMVSVQDVSTWGDTRQILINDGNDSFSLFQAWARMQLSDNWAAKVGRQVISYDDQRIFGGLDWAMQGRFHDAALLQYNKGSFAMDMGFAYGQEEQRLFGSPYMISGFFTYKTMQYAHLKKTWTNSAVSLLFLNNGFQKFTGPDGNVADGVYNRQTAGSYFQFPLSSLKFSGSAYYQFGQATPSQDLSAYQVSLEGIYKPGSTLFGLGAEFLSGTDQGSTGDNNSFFPLYGTNHKFNGFMDYFYVGNHANNVGLNDFYAKTVFKTGATSSLLLKAHYFSSNADLAGDADNYLGTEIDVVFTRPVVKNVVLNLGYSHMFASESMSLIKGGTTNENTNNWGWAQLIINPRIFQFQFNAED